MRPPPLPSPRRVFLTGTGGILVISDSESKWGGDLTVVVATAAILAGALFAAIASGYSWPSPSQRYQVGAYICSATAVTSMWATDAEHFLVMSAVFGKPRDTIV